MPASTHRVGVGSRRPDHRIAPRPPARLRTYILAYGLITAFLILAHGPLLKLPYYWDEIGQFIPASLDLFRAGAWIPLSTVPNVHPPGLMVYLSAFWSVFGYSVAATRIAMLLIAGLGGLATFLLAIELSRGAPGAPAFAALAIFCISPLFFAQSMLAQLDMPAMVLSIFALLLYLQNRIQASSIVCVVLVLVKETGLVVPLVLGVWALIDRRNWKAAWFLLPLPALAAWLFILHRATGHWLGNPEFAAYNVSGHLHPLTVVLAVARRLYYVFIGSGHFIGTVVLLWALRRMPLLSDRPWKIAWSLVMAQIIVVSALGGAVLERYLLPVIPIAYISFALSLQSLAPHLRHLAAGCLLACLGAANFINPPYPFPFENNLAFVDFVNLEQRAADAISFESSSVPGGGRVVTAFPLADALKNPDFGFVDRAKRVVKVEDFSRTEIERMKQQAPDFVVVYKREWDPLHLLDRPKIRDFMTSHFGYKDELNAQQTAEVLSMRVNRTWRKGGLTMSLLTR